MSNTVEKSWKSRLQEYCQKKKLSLPNYRISQEPEIPTKPKFQVSISRMSDMSIQEDEWGSHRMPVLSFRLKSKSVEVGTLAKRIVYQRKKQKIQQLTKHVLIS